MYRLSKTGFFRCIPTSREKCCIEIISSFHFFEIKNILYTTRVWIRKRGLRSLFRHLYILADILLFVLSEIKVLFSNLFFPGIHSHIRSYNRNWFHPRFSHQTFSNIFSLNNIMITKRNWFTRQFGFHFSGRRGRERERILKQVERFCLWDSRVSVLGGCFHFVNITRDQLFLEGFCLGNSSDKNEFVPNKY